MDGRKRKAPNQGGVGLCSAPRIGTLRTAANPVSSMTRRRALLGAEDRNPGRGGPPAGLFGRRRALLGAEDRNMTVDGVRFIVDYAASGFARRRGSEPAQIDHIDDDDWAASGFARRRGSEPRLISSMPIWAAGRRRALLGAEDRNPKKASRPRRRRKRRRALLGAEDRNEESAFAFGPGGLAASGFARRRGSEPDIENACDRDFPSGVGLCSAPRIGTASESGSCSELSAASGFARRRGSELRRAGRVECR